MVLQNDRREKKTWQYHQLTDLFKTTKKTIENVNNDYRYE